MLKPNVVSRIKDTENDVTYEIIAYRTLSKSELVQAVRAYHMQHKAKKLKKGSTITILSIIGLNE